MYVYIEVDGLFEVGFYDPRGNFITESKHEADWEAGYRVHFLNGGDDYIKEGL